MSGQALDLRRSAQIVRRHKALVGAAAAVGLIAGAAYTVLHPPAYTSTALVALSPSISITTQEVVAVSAPVLSLALPSIGPGMSLQAMHGRVRAADVAVGLMSVSAQGSTPARAVETANAVAHSYVAYASSADNPGGQQQVQLFERATSATGTTLTTRLLQAAAASIPAGALVGAVIALAIGRNDRRLRKRDEIADSIGVPVMASVRVRRPVKAAGWSKLLGDYEPEGADAWQWRRMLRQLEVAGLSPARAAAGGDGSLAVLSLSSDRGALALGPQLAVFAASRGIPAALVVGPQQDADAIAALRAACAAARSAAAPSGRPGPLHVIVSDDGDVSRLPGGVLAIVVAVVDGRAPRVASTMRPAMTVLGVSSGAVTAQQVARVAASAAADGRDIGGILVADPDAADQTTGLAPQPARSGQHRMPTRLTSAVTEIRQ